jgi:hypothetical protein
LAAASAGPGHSSNMQELSDKTSVLIIEDEIQIRRLLLGTASAMEEAMPAAAVRRTVTT